MCVDINVNNVISASFKVNLGYGDPYKIRVEVPWKPQACTNCKIFEHSTNNCPLKPITTVKTSKEVGKKPVEKHVWVEVTNRKAKGKEVATLSVVPSPSQKMQGCSSSQVSRPPIVAQKIVGHSPFVGEKDNTVHSNSTAKRKILLDKIYDLQRLRKAKVETKDGSTLCRSS